jgi:hypothetical protein
MFSDTFLLDAAAAAQIVLAIAGVVMSFMTIARRWLKWTAVAAFIVVGSIGFVAVHLTAASAEHQRHKADLQQRALQDKIDQLLKGQTNLSKSTEALAKRPVQVTVREPKEPGPWKSGPLLLAQKSVHPETFGGQSAVELTIQADREMPDATIEVVCDAPIFGDPRIEAIASSIRPENHMVHIGDRAINITLNAPSLSETQPYNVTLESGQHSPPIHVVNVRQVHTLP